MLPEDFCLWLLERRQRRPHRMHAAGKTRRCQRSRQEIAVMDRQPNDVSVVVIEIGMRSEKGLRLGNGRIAEAIDIMMAVALGMGDADQCAEREVLLYPEAGLTGQVLAGNETLFALRAPFGGAGGIDDRLVDALAGFRGDTAIADRACGRKRLIGIV